MSATNQVEQVKTCPYAGEDYINKSKFAQKLNQSAKKISIEEQESTVVKYKRDVRHLGSYCSKYQIQGSEKTCNNRLK